MFAPFAWLDVPNYTVMAALVAHVAAGKMETPGARHRWSTTT
jgi:hypothetical protein